MLSVHKKLVLEKQKTFEEDILNRFALDSRRLALL